MGLCIYRSMAQMVSSSSASGVELIPGKIIFLGLIGFSADDSAWLPDVPLNIESLLGRGNMHFRTNNSGILFLQEPVPYRAAGSIAVRLLRKHSSKPRLHCTSRRSVAHQVAMVHPSDSLHNLFESISEDGENCRNLSSMAEVMMASTPRHHRLAPIHLLHHAMLR